MRCIQCGAPKIINKKIILGAVEDFKKLINIHFTLQARRFSKYYYFKNKNMCTNRLKVIKIKS